MANTDPRYLEAGKVLRSVIPGTPVKLYKTTRAGATTGLCANAIDSNQKFCLIAPTKMIAHATIDDTLEYSNNKDVEVKTIVSNHECELNKERIKKYPELDALPILPIPGTCDTCTHRNECEVTKFVDGVNKTFGGVGLTYHKLLAIMLSDSDLPALIRDKLCEMDVFVFDECHSCETPESHTIDICPLDYVDYLSDKLRHNAVIQEYLLKFKRVLQSIEPDVETLLEQKDEHTNTIMTANISETYSVNVASKGMKEIVKIMMNRRKHELLVKDVVYLSGIVLLMNESSLVLNYLKFEGEDKIQLTCKSGLHSCIREFLDMIGPKKVIFTTATFGEMDYTPVFGESRTCVMKDTMQSNTKMIVYPDTFTLDSINYSKKYHNKIVNSVLYYASKFPGVTFVCMNKKMSWWLKKRIKEKGVDIEVDYYRSDLTLGVANKARECVCVGAPICSINAFDGISQTYEESQNKRVCNNHAAFWQAVSRFKDPAGKVQSHIHCIGITKDELTLMLRWGTARMLNMDGIKCQDVSAGNDFSEATILSKNDMKVLRLLQELDFNIDKVLSKATRKFTQKTIVASLLNLRKLEII